MSRLSLDYHGLSGWPNKARHCLFWGHGKCVLDFPGPWNSRWLEGLRSPFLALSLSFFEVGWLSARGCRDDGEEASEGGSKVATRIRWNSKEELGEPELRVLVRRVESWAVGSVVGCS